MKTKGHSSVNVYKNSKWNINKPNPVMYKKGNIINLGLCQEYNWPQEQIKGEKSYSYLNRYKNVFDKI